MTIEIPRSIRYFPTIPEDDLAMRLVYEKLKGYELLPFVRLRELLISGSFVRYCDNRLPTPILFKYEDLEDYVKVLPRDVRRIMKERTVMNAKIASAVFTGIRLNSMGWDARDAIKV